MTPYLFTYGTLLSGIGHPMYEFIERYASFCGPGQIHGQLYEVSDYPALVLSNNSKKIVRGEIYRVRDADALFKYLDDYEGCAPHSRRPYEYQRNLVTIHDARQHSLLAWTYLYKYAVGQLALIPSGDYLAYRNKSRLKMVNRFRPPPKMLSRR